MTSIKIITKIINFNVFRLPEVPPSSRDLPTHCRISHLINKIIQCNYGCNFSLTAQPVVCGSGGHTASQQEQTHRNSLLLRCSTYFFSQIAHPLPPRNEGTATGSMMNFSIRSPTTAQKDDGFSYGKTIPQKHKRGLLGKFSCDCQSEQGSIALLLSYGSQKGQTY